MVEEAREIGGCVYHPHALTLLRRNQDFQMQSRAVDAATLTIGLLEYTSPVRIRTQALENGCQVNSPVRGRIKMAYGGQEVITPPALAGVHGPEQETGLEGWDRPASMLGLKIPKRFLEQELAALLDRAPEQAVEFTGTLELDRRRAQEWRSAVELLAQSLRTKDSIVSNPLVAGPAAQAVVRGLLPVAPNNYTAELTGDVSAVGSVYVRQAVEFIEDHAHEPLTVGAIATAVHVSVRSLQLGFKEHLGSTPTAVLRDVRMHRVREELLQAPLSARVAEVAARWGFAQAGRFAVQYCEDLRREPLRNPEEIKPQVGRPAAAVRFAQVSVARRGRRGNDDVHHIRPASHPSERLGRHRWVVERTIAWLLTFRCLAIRYDRSATTITALATLAITIICARRLSRGDY